MTTREYIKQFRREDPEIRAAQMAELLDVSRSRVGKILKEENLSTRIPTVNNSLCTKCGAETVKKKKFCSPECYEKYFWIDVACMNGDGTIRMRQKTYERKLRRDEMSFHNHSCMFKYLWKTKPHAMGRSA